MTQALSVVKVGVDARGAISPLNQTTAAANRLSAAAKGTTASLAATSTAAKGMGASMMAAMGPFIALGAAVATVSSGLKTFSDRERDITILRQGLQNLDKGTRSLNKLQKVADKLGKQTLFNQEDFTRGFNLLTSFRNIGVDSYERVAQSAADVAQVNQVDVKTSFMQLAKALQDPARNLAALNRSGIAFTKEQTNMIKKLMETNRVAEAHNMILDIVDESYNKLAQAAAGGFAGDVDTLGESWRDFGEALGKAVIPVLTPVVKGLTVLLDAVTKIPTPVLEVVAAVAGAAGLVFAFQQLKGAIIGVNLVLSLSPWYLAAAGLAAVAVGIYKLINANKALSEDVLLGKEGSADKAVKKIEELQEKLKILKEKGVRTGSSYLLGDTFREATEEDIAPLQQAINLLTSSLNEVGIAADGSMLAIKEGAEGATEGIETTIDYVSQLETTFNGIIVTVRDGLVDAIMGAVDGTKTLGEVASSVFNSISRSLIQYGVSAGLSGMFPWMAPALGFGKKASGGPVSKDKPYLVGERGPEMFVPNSSGRVVPNNQMGGESTSVVVNVDASGSAVQGDGGQAEELGSMLAAAVQAEIANQQRPGGLLAGTR